MNNTKSVHEEKELFKKNALPLGTILSSKSRTYKVVEVLGAGGFGITYKVSSKTQVGNIEVDTYFAIKEYFMKGCYRDGNGTQMLYAPTLKLDVEQGREDFITEAKRLNKLSGQSPNIVKVNELFMANDTAYYVMEYLNGGDLIQYVKKNGVLNERTALSIFVQIAEAVELLHSERLLHLDIKPDNIVLKTDANNHSTLPVLIDFGIAKHFGRDGKPTSRLMAKGATDGYAPMEQYADITQFAPEIDVYALGATLYYLLTGKNPPKAFDIVSMDIIRNALPIQTNVSIINLIVSAMQKNKFERTQTVRQMITDITNILSCALPLGHVLKTQHKNFQIIDVLSETEYSITYKAIEVHSLNGQTTDGQRSRMTKVANQYIIMEYFCKSENDRYENGTVYRDYPIGSEPSFHPFIEDVANRAHCEVNQVYFYFRDNADVSWQFFTANGTCYYVEKVVIKPSILDKIIEILNILKQRVVTRKFMTLAILGLVVCMLILIAKRYNNQNKDNAIESIRDSLSLKEDSLSLSDGMKHDEKQEDSLTPAKIPVTQKEEVSEPVKEKPLQEPKQQEQKVTVQEQPKPSQSETRHGNLQPSSEIHVQSQSQRLAEALNNPSKGIGVIAALVQEKYAPAYYHYAKSMLNNGNTKQARYYLQLSIEAGVNVQQSKDLLDILDE